MKNQERLTAILEKCEFYWNHDGIPDAEIHAVLERIHEHAREVAKAFSPQAPLTDRELIVAGLAYRCCEKGDNIQQMEYLLKQMFESANARKDKP